MLSTRHERLESLFNEALERKTDAERAAFLDGACGSDAPLRTQIEALLRAYREAGSFLESPIVDPDATLSSRPLTEAPGTRIGRYKLLQLIGEGGFGAVYMAEQEVPVRRKVALKIIKLGMDTKQVIARFEAERQALALMEHPNIARVLDAGATDTGRPYFVMELVRGIPITDFCDKSRLLTADRLTLFIQVCYAVQHAHQKGIIHRDIKPSNVLVTLHDSLPVPKVIDFGIAKATSQRLTEKTLFTEFRQFIGTPEYMSPDQAEFSGLDVDTRTDIYSLGVLLYVLLTGTTPFDGQTMRSAGFDELKRIIRDVEPPRPSVRVHTLARSETGLNVANRRQCEPAALSRVMHGDLDWIVMKAMEKDRTRRYQTASELAQDVQRHLNNEPVVAGPPSVLYRAAKFARRNRVAVGAGALVAAALVSGLIVATTFYFEAVRERDAARAAEARADTEAQRSERIANLLQALFVSTSPDQALTRGVEMESVLAAAREAFGNDHAAVAATLSSRAMQLQSAGDLEGAGRMYNESLRLWRDRFGDDNINVAATLRSLGLLQSTKGDNLAAEQSFRECIRITRALPSGETITLADTLSQLANVLINRGQYDEAVELLEESIRLRASVAPAQRLQIAVTFNTLVSTLALAGNDAGLQVYMPEVVEAWRAAVPPESTTLANVLTQNAVFHLDHGAYAKAEDQLRDALNIYQITGNAASSRHSLALSSLYRILEHRGEPAAILPWALRGLEAARSTGSEQAIMEAQRSLANFCWYVARNQKRCREEYEAAQEGVETILAQYPDDYLVRNTLGVLQYRLGRYVDALATLQDCDDFNSQKYAYGHPTDTAFIAAIYQKLGLREPAQAALARVRLAMQTPQFAGDEDSRNVANEVEALFGTRVLP